MADRRSRRCIIYCRISQDDGSRLGVERQRQDCEALADRLGWIVVYRAVDNDVSASATTASGAPKIRPEYERMMADLEAGRADALVCWDVDRLTRRPVELERVIDLAEKHGVALASVGGEIDLGSPQGRLTARIKGSVARHEVEQLSRRLRRKWAENAQAGRPHGKPGYGWRRVAGRDALEPDEAEIVAEIVTRLLGQESVSGIARSLNDRMVAVPNDAKRWTTSTVRQLALRPSNAGLRLHQGKVVGRYACDPIISEDDHLRLMAYLKDPARTAGKTNRHRYLLSGIALCGVCSHPVEVLTGSGGRISSYICRSCLGVRRQQAAVDALVTSLVCERLARPDAIAAFAENPAEDREGLFVEAQSLRAKLDLAADQFAEDVIDADQLRRITTKVRARLMKVETELGGRSGRTDLVDLATGDIAKRWEGVPIERRRAVVKLLVEVRILPRRSGTPRYRFDPSTVAVNWRVIA